MKRNIYIIIIVMFSQFFSAQYDLLAITGLNITQNNEHQIKINLKVHTASVAEYVSYSSDINQNTITISACYYVTGLTLPMDFDNDFYIDIPPVPNNYTLIMKVYASGNSSVCDYFSLEETATLNFSAPIDGTVSMGTVNADYKNKAIAIFPNPVKDVLHFSEEVTNIKITDVSGKMVKEISAKGKSVNIANLAKGVYIISAVTKSGGIVNRKIVKE